MNAAHVHSQVVPCPSCGTRFVFVSDCPVCGAYHSAYPHWVKVLIAETDGSKTLSQIRFCCRNHAVQGVGKLHLEFVFKDDAYLASETIEMNRNRYEALMISFGTSEPMNH